jgi:hypothetical protein
MTKWKRQKLSNPLLARCHRIMQRETSSAEELNMRRSMIAAVFAALATAALCTGANAAPAGPSLLVAKASETSVTQVYLRHRHWRGSYRSRVYGYRHAYRPRVYGYRHAGYYRPRVYGYYSSGVYGYRGYRGCGW